MVSRVKLDMLARKARTLIKQHGWMIQSVFPDAEEGINGYSYTVGLSSKFNHPEIFLAGYGFDIGGDHRLAQRLLNDVASLVQQGMRFEESTLCHTVIAGLPVAFVPADDDAVRQASSAGRHYLHRTFKGVQMFIPDPNGRFPWDEGCAPIYVEFQALLPLAGAPPSRDSTPRMN